ncbi:uncharacterized protein VDAG_10329 [Verticillium dahliae VdLs.17]|uniref:Uncharacterized protein n=2 Tax=Verticillium dahliae TaxID=27337 RepID=G2XJJ7_VERDV|nr:uncharacterized protein VDAG_10329 [Verticillium dahliae VdLs.17]EGY20700.1 hypothetical protein VDAG_10329 [Verticillium dahliae VdLs.17]KAH6705647.1 hypothetical protein EV126DRAFT_357544 [Verticillium dahliae]
MDGKSGGQGRLLSHWSWSWTSTPWQACVLSRSAPGLGTNRSSNASIAVADPVSAALSSSTSTANDIELQPWRSTSASSLTSKESQLTPFANLRSRPHIHTRTSSVTSLCSTSSTSTTTSNTSTSSVKSQEAHPSFRSHPHTMATPGARKVRAGVIAACFAAVVFTGAIYGAGIKTQQEWTEKRGQFRQSPLSEQISVLESQRQGLVEQRATLTNKLAAFEARVRERDAKAAKEASEAAR